MDTGDDLSVEGRLLASQALEPKQAAKVISAALPAMTRPPSKQELLRLAEFPEMTGQTLADIVRNKANRTTVVNRLLAVRDRVEANRIRPVLKAMIGPLMEGDKAALRQGINLIGAFQLQSMKDRLVKLLKQSPELRTDALNALQRLNLDDPQPLIRAWRDSTEERVRQTALAILARMRQKEASQWIFNHWDRIATSHKQIVLAQLSRHQTGALAIVDAAVDGPLLIPACTMFIERLAGDRQIAAQYTPPKKKRL